MRRDLVIGVLLAVITAAVYARVYHHGFIALDDNQYLVTNEFVQDGLTWRGAVWAFTATHCANWHPLTWLSHMLDAQLFGLWAGGHHLTNVLLHIGNAVLLYVLLRRMTGAVWRSAMVAALFALHPLRVESVAWAAERKDVLNVLFGFLAMLAYVRYVACPSLLRYLLVVLLYVLALMAKPMLVTLPCLLLLLDYWPLERWPITLPLSERESGAMATNRWKTAGWLLIEKLPLFALAGISSAVTLYAQQGAMAPIEHWGFFARLGNAMLAYVGYIGQTILPIGMAPFYPIHREVPFWQPWAAGVVILVITVVLLWMGRRRPYLAVGWLWFLGSLVPVIGLVQVGIQSMADRYTYIPQIGLFIVMVWGFYDVSLSWRPLQRWLPTLATAAVLVLSLLTWRQAGYWSDSITLGKHTIATTGPNVVFESELGVGLMNRGLNDEAEAHFRKAIAIQPANPQPHGNLGTLLLRANRLDEAIQEYLVLLKLNPDDPRAHSQLGTIYTMQKKLEEAEKEFREAVRITPTSYEAHHNLALTLQSRGKTAEAIEQYHETLRLRPEFPSGLNNFAWVLATHPDAKYRNGAEAVALVQRALAIVPQEADYLDTLAVAQAEIGQFDEATKTIEKALVLAQKLNRSDFAKDLEKRRDLFRRRQPYRDPSLMGP